MFRKLVEPCGLHCIRMTDIGVTVGEQEILKNINLHIHCGTLAAVIGKNGAGKSTLIKAILGDIPHTGTIEFSLHEKGTVISNKKMDLKIGYVPQSLNIEKKTPISVYEMIACYQSAYPVFWKISRALYRKILDALALFQASELIDKQVCNLSGGELQRFCIARALAPGVKYLLCDEITAMLDPITQAQIWNVLLAQAEERQLGLLIVSHDSALLERLCTRIQRL